MESPRHDLIPHPAVRRLSLYLRQLESIAKKGRRTTSSKLLAEAIHLTDAQVRKDLAHFGQFGRPGVGYRVDELTCRLRHILGTDKTWNVLLVGFGNLGRALLAYRGFETKGLKIVAVCDSDPEKVGQHAGSLVVAPLEDMAKEVRQKQIRLAILAVPGEAAQDMADQLVAAGVTGLLNFAPISLGVPANVSLIAVDLAVQLEQLVFQVTTAPGHKLAATELIT